ncbi:hypothetical protein SLS63_012775 [Diaporthe eres]|uniref:F-box domain-containing protein n=1 Tax=Diaporthe eres TaxID=83184 RepID=A0ABR1NQB7_DIAER
MAEGYCTDHSPDQTPSLGVDMEALDIQDKTEMDAQAVSNNLRSLPPELIHQMVEYLPPANDAVQVGHAGSDALRSAQAGLGALRALCQVSSQLRAVVRPDFYRAIVISEPCKLHRLRETLDNYPELGEYVKSLTVYRDLNSSDIENQRLLDDGHHVPQTITLSQFSETLVAVLKKTPNLVTLSLNFDQTTPFEGTSPFAEFKHFLHMNISRANDPNDPQEFLPKVVTLGILLPPARTSRTRTDRPEEYQTFKDLLNLPSLSHIIVRRPVPEPFQAYEIYLELLNSIKSQFRFAPMLETLRIPMRLFRDPDDENGVMFHPGEVLPGTLQSLVLTADLRVFPKWHADGEDVLPVEEDYQDEGITIPYPIARHLSIQETIWFLETIAAISPTYFSQLNMLRLGYGTSRINDRDFAAINEMLNSVERDFVSEIQALQGTMEQNGIHFYFNHE